MKTQFQIISLVLMGISILMFILNYIRLRSWIVTIGVVVGMEDEKNEDGIESYRPMIMYTHDKYGEQVFKPGEWTKYTWLKGDLIEIIYDQSKMGSAKVNKFYFKYYYSINIGLFGLVGLIFIFH